MCLYNVNMVPAYVVYAHMCVQGKVPMHTCVDMRKISSVLFFHSLSYSFKMSSLTEHGGRL